MSADEKPVSDNGQSPEPPSAEPVWTFRGYQMRPAEFNTAMVHFYRGEVQRSNTWRMRLDNTTNWAVVAAGAAISFALSDPTHHYGVIILDTLLVTLFLWIEARRYRYYELWSYRVRLMETDFFASMLVPPFAPHSEWAESLAETLLNPEFPISMWEAFGRRFRRNYVWIFLILGVAWALKGFLHPVPATSWDEFISRSALGSIPSTSSTSPASSSSVGSGTPGAGAGTSTRSPSGSSDRTPCCTASSNRLFRVSPFRW